MSNDLVMNLGVDWLRTFTYANADLTPVNLTGYKARMSVKGSPQDKDSILVLTTENGAITIDPLVGVISVTVTHAQLTEGPTGLDLGSIVTPASIVSESGTGNMMIEGFGKVGYYDLDIISPSNWITKISTGKVCFDYSITG